jgi:hypothetical protein
MNKFLILLLASINLSMAMDSTGAAEASMKDLYYQLTKKQYEQYISYKDDPWLDTAPKIFASEFSLNLSSLKTTESENIQQKFLRTSPKDLFLKKLKSALIKYFANLGDVNQETITNQKFFEKAQLLLNISDLENPIISKEESLGIIRASLKDKKESLKILLDNSQNINQPTKDFFEITLFPDIAAQSIYDELMEKLSPAIEISKTGRTMNLIKGQENTDDLLVKAKAAFDNYEKTPQTVKEEVIKLLTKKNQDYVKDRNDILIFSTKNILDRLKAGYKMNDLNLLLSEKSNYFLQAYNDAKKSFDQADSDDKLAEMSKLIQAKTDLLITYPEKFLEVLKASMSRENFAKIQEIINLINIYPPDELNKRVKEFAQENNFELLDALNIIIQNSVLINDDEKKTVQDKIIANQKEHLASNNASINASINTKALLPDNSIKVSTTIDEFFEKYIPDYNLNTSDLQKTYNEIFPKKLADIFKTENFTTTGITNKIREAFGGRQLDDKTRAVKRFRDVLIKKLNTGSTYKIGNYDLVNIISEANNLLPDKEKFTEQALKQKLDKFYKSDYGIAKLAQVVEDNQTAAETKLAEETRKKAELNQQRQEQLPREFENFITTRRDDINITRNSDEYNTRKSAIDKSKKSFDIDYQAKLLVDSIFVTRSEYEKEIPFERFIVQKLIYDQSDQNFKDNVIKMLNNKGLSYLEKQFKKNIDDIGMSDELIEFKSTLPFKQTQADAAAADAAARQTEAARLADAAARQTEAARLADAAARLADAAARQTEAARLADAAKRREE